MRGPSLASHSVLGREERCTARKFRVAVFRQAAPKEKRCLGSLLDFGGRTHRAHSLVDSRSDGIREGGGVTGNDELEPEAEGISIPSRRFRCRWRRRWRRRCRRLLLGRRRRRRRRLLLGRWRHRDEIHCLLHCLNRCQRCRRSLAQNGGKVVAKFRSQFLLTGGFGRGEQNREDRRGLLANFNSACHVTGGHGFLHLGLNCRPVFAAGANCAACLQDVEMRLQGHGKCVVASGLGRRDLLFELIHGLHLQFTGSCMVAGGRQLLDPSINGRPVFAPSTETRGAIRPSGVHPDHLRLALFERQLESIQEEAVQFDIGEFSFFCGGNSDCPRVFLERNHLPKLLLHLLQLDHSFVFDAAVRHLVNKLFLVPHQFTELSDLACHPLLILRELLERDRGHWGVCSGRRGVGHNRSSCQSKHHQRCRAAFEPTGIARGAGRGGPVNHRKRGARAPSAQRALQTCPCADLGHAPRAAPSGPPGPDLPASARLLAPHSHTTLGTWRLSPPKIVRYTRVLGCAIQRIPSSKTDICLS